MLSSCYLLIPLGMGHTNSVPRFTFNVQIGTKPVSDLRNLARKAEDHGISAILVADHPGHTASAFATLSYLAAITNTIQLGTYVLNTAVRHPIDVANDLLTLDMLSNGRAIAGLGAGHTPLEWTSRGLKYPSAGERVTQFIHFVEQLQPLLRGEVVTCPPERPSGRPVCDHAEIVDPRPTRPNIPLLIGGNGRRVLALAGRVADIVGFTGLGKTLADGHRHEAMWNPEEVDASVRCIGTERTPIRDSLVQCLEITNNRNSTLERFAKLADVEVAALTNNPFILVGTRSDISEQMISNYERWGITNYTIRDSSIDDAITLLKTAT
jgi:probable F420-dependent oxidoreductase